MNKTLCNIFKIVSALGFMSAGCFIAVMVECGIDYRLLLGLILSLLCAVLYRVSSKKLKEEV